MSLQMTAGIVLTLVHALVAYCVVRSLSPHTAGISRHAPSRLAD